MNVLLIYEIVPEETKIALLTKNDLESGKVSLEELREIAGKLMNSDDLTETQQNTMDKINDNLDSAWKDRIVDNNAPLEIAERFTVIFCGFVL